MRLFSNIFIQTIFILSLFHSFFHFANENFLEESDTHSDICHPSETSEKENDLVDKCIENSYSLSFSKVIVEKIKLIENNLNLIFNKQIKSYTTFYKLEITTISPYCLFQSGIRYLLI